METLSHGRTRNPLALGENQHLGCVLAALRMGEAFLARMTSQMMKAYQQSFLRLTSGYSPFSLFLTFLDGARYRSISHLTSICTHSRRQSRIHPILPLPNSKHFSYTITKNPMAISHDQRGGVSLRFQRFRIASPERQLVGRTRRRD